MWTTAGLPAAARRLALLASVGACELAWCQGGLVYVEPGNAACPAPPAPRPASAPRSVPSGTAVPGSISVACGFGQGSYTVTLGSTDPHAHFAPRTFLVNFGKVVGDGAFTVTFATPGVHGVSATITSNMGSPAVPGRFVGTGTEFEVVRAP
jgi:hypothetical protein